MALLKFGKRDCNCNANFLASVLQVLYAYGHVYKTFAFFYVSNVIYYYRKKFESIIVA